MIKYTSIIIAFPFKSGMNKVGSHGRRRFLTVVNIHSVFYIHVLYIYFILILYISSEEDDLGSGEELNSPWKRVCPFISPFIKDVLRLF